MVIQKLMYLNASLLKFGLYSILQVCYIMFSMNFMAWRWKCFSNVAPFNKFLTCARDDGSTTASQPWKALIFGSNKMCRHFFCTFPCFLLALSCSFFAILAALQLWWSRFIGKCFEPTSSNHVVKWSQLLSSPTMYLASNCIRTCRPNCRGFGHYAQQRGADL